MSVSNGNPHPYNEYYDFTVATKRFNASALMDECANVGRVLAERPAACCAGGDEVGRCAS